MVEPDVPRPSNRIGAAEPIFVPVLRPALDEVIERMSTVEQEHRADPDGSQAASGGKVG